MRLCITCSSLNYSRGRKNNRQKKKKKRSQEHWYSFLGWYMMVTMNILVQTKSFVFFGKVGVWMSQMDAEELARSLHFYL